MGLVWYHENQKKTQMKNTMYSNGTTDWYGTKNGTEGPDPNPLSASKMPTGL